MKPLVAVVIVAGAFMLSGSHTAPVYAQSPERRIDVGGHISVLRLSEFDTTDAGAGVNKTWGVTPSLALGGTLTWFNGGDSTSLAHRIAHQTRVLGLAGGRYGIQRGLVEWC